MIAANTIDRDRFFVTHDQQMIGNNVDLTMGLAAVRYRQSLRGATSDEPQLDHLRARRAIRTIIRTTMSASSTRSKGVYGPEFPDTRDSRLDDVAGSFEDRLKVTPAFALIGGYALEAFTLDRSGVNFDGSIPTGQPFSKTWTPVSYRGAPIPTNRSTI